jgi:hypothetical protein
MKLEREKRPFLTGWRYKLSLTKADTKYGNGVCWFEDAQQLERFSEKLRQLVEAEQRETAMRNQCTDWVDHNTPRVVTNEANAPEDAGDDKLLLVLRAINLYTTLQSEHGLMDLEARDKALSELGLS